MLIPGRSALSRRGSMSIQNLNFLKVSYPGTPCILSSSSSSTYVIYREICLTFISLLKNIVNLFKWLIVKLNICQILLLHLLTFVAKPQLPAVSSPSPISSFRPHCRPDHPHSLLELKQSHIPLQRPPPC